MKRLVRKHSSKMKHSKASYVVFCTAILAPKFCSLYVPPNPPEPEIVQYISSCFDGNFEEQEQQYSGHDKYPAPAIVSVSVVKCNEFTG